MSESNGLLPPLDHSQRTPLSAFLVPGWATLGDCLTLKPLGGGVFNPPPVIFWLIISEVESFSTGNFVTFPDIKCRIKTKQKCSKFCFSGSREMTISGEWAS